MEIRLAKKSDLEEINKLYNYYITHTAFTFDTKKKTLSEITSWYDKFGETKIIKKVCKITFKPTNVIIDKILKVTKSHGLTILDLQTKDANLEDVFMSLTKN